MALHPAVLSSKEAGSLFHLLFTTVKWVDIKHRKGGTQYCAEIKMEEMVQAQLISLVARFKQLGCYGERYRTGAIYTPPHTTANTRLILWLGDARVISVDSRLFVVQSGDVLIVAPHQAVHVEAATQAAIAVTCFGTITPPTLPLPEAQ